MNKLLFVTHYYPPYGGVGVIRVAKFAKYLPEYGWEPIVLTTEINDKMPLRDFELWDEVENKGRVIRTNISKYGFINDEDIRWLPALTNNSLKLCSSEKIDAILISGGPFFSFLAGYICQKLHKIPYIIDYRDGWSIDGNDRPSSAKAKAVALASKALERQIIHQASSVIFTSPITKKNYEAWIGSSLQSKSCLVTNGYDKPSNADSQTKRIHHADQARIVYAGKVNYSTPIKELTHAFESLVARDSIWRRKIRFVFIGQVESNYRSLLDQSALGESIEYKGFMPYSQCMKYMSEEADILLSMDYDPSLIPTKLYDYLSLKKPMIVIEPPDGPFEQLTGRQAKGITIANSKDGSDIARGLEDILVNKHSLEVDQGFIDQFSRKNLARRLSVILDEATKKAVDK